MSVDETRKDLKQAMFDLIDRHIEEDDCESCKIFLAFMLFHVDKDSKFINYGMSRLIKSKEREK